MGVEWSRRLWCVGVASVIALAGAARGQGEAIDPERAARERVRVGGPGEVKGGMPGAADAEMEPAEAVKRLLAQGYLSEEEKRDLRVFHGVAETADLDTPARRARWALVRGAWGDASLSDPGAAVEDRAEGQWRRGELAEALATLEGVTSVRGVRLRAAVLESLGRRDEAAKALANLPKLDDKTTASDAVELGRALVILSRVAPQTQPAGGDFQQINRLLAAARTVSGLYWPARLAEAELLYSKHNGADAQAAAAEAFGLNPKAADAMFVLASMTVDGFAFDKTEQIAVRLEAAAEGPSVYASIVRARAAMRQSDPDGAEAAIAKALEAFPKQRTLLAIRAAVAGLRYDWAATDRLLAEFDALSPGSPEALMEVGRVLAEARQYSESDRYLKRATELAPHLAEPLSERGLMLIQAARDGEAIAVLARAVELDPFNTRAENSLTLARELATYTRVETPHFVIRHRPGVDGVLAREMPRLLEGMYKRVTGSDHDGIDHEPATKTVIDLMPDARWFAVRIAGVTRIHTMAASTGPAVAMEVPRSGPGSSVGTYDWLRVLRHEFVHTVTLSRTKNRIPHWFTEASAVFLEDALRDYNTIKLLSGAWEAEQLFDLKAINIAFVRPKRPQDRALAYAQGHWMYEYIVRRFGTRAPLELMDRYATGMREEAAMREVLGVSSEDLLAGFRVWAGEQLAEWGMRLKKGEPTVRTILRAEAIGTDEARQAVRDGGGDTDDASTAKAAGMTPEIARRWLTWYPGHSELLERLVRLTLKERGGSATEEDVALLLEYAKARPVDPLPHQQLARLWLPAARGGDRRAIERVLPHLEFMDVRETGAAVYASELARLYGALGELEKAQEKAERAVIVAPFEATHREEAARVAVQRKDFATAERHLVALVELEPDRAVHKARLEALRKMKQ